MNLTIYAKNIKGPGTKLQVVCESLACNEEIQIFNSIESLTKWLLQTTYEKAVVVLIAEKREELSELLPVLPLFRKVQIVLILPDRQSETIRIGYRLEPRLLRFIDSGFEEIRAILRNMLARSRSFGEPKSMGQEKINNEISPKKVLGGKSYSPQ